jgi:hypothetical protein
MRDSVVWGALPGLVAVAASSRAPLAFSDLPGDPAGLLAVHRLFPDLVYEALRRILASSKDDRIDACEAIGHVAELDPEIGLKLAPDLITSLSLPDDMYNRGSAGTAVARVLAATMHRMPQETDLVVGQAMAAASEDVGVALVRIYSEVLRAGVRSQSRVPTDADRIALHRVVQVLLDRRIDERLSEATHVLRDCARYFPSLITTEGQTLLGATALIADDLKERYSPLLDPRPTPEKALEAQTRQLRLRSALDAITAALSVAMAHSPESIIQQVLEALSGLGSSHPTLRAELVRGFGALRGNSAAIAAIVPTLYSSMLDQEQEVRAAAATVYGEVTEHLAADDLPKLLHETFLTCFEILTS